MEGETLSSSARRDARSSVELSQSILRMETGDTLVPNLARRRGQLSEPRRLLLPATTSTTAPNTHCPTPAVLGDDDVTPIQPAASLAARPRDQKDLASARRPLAFGQPAVLPPCSAPMHRGGASHFPELHPSVDAVFFSELAEALHRLRPSEGMPTRRLALHKVARLLGEVPSGADSGRLRSVMATADALALLVSMLRDACVADCATADVWLLHCALALCVNLACHDPESVLEAGLARFVLSGLAAPNERTCMLCAAGAHNLAASLDGALLVLEPTTRARLEELSRSDNMGAAHHASRAIAEALKARGGGQLALWMARASLGVLLCSMLLLALILLLALEQRSASEWGPARFQRHLAPLLRRRASESASAPVPRVCE